MTGAERLAQELASIGGDAVPIPITLFDAGEECSGTVTAIVGLDGFEEAHSWVEWVLVARNPRI